MKITLLLCLTAVGQTFHVLGQGLENAPHPNPPIPVEVSVNNRGLNSQLSFSRQFTPTSRFGFFNVTNFLGTYKNELAQNEFFSQSLLTARIWKKLSAVTGFSINNAVGFKPTAGLQLLQAGPKVLAVIQPQIGLTEDHHFETFSLLEYKPKINKTWGIYTRIQGLIDYGFSQKVHNRSYVYLRAGASYKNYQFGISKNFDFYGPAKHYENSLGVFIRAELF
jgi:hypothetical protein